MASPPKSPTKVTTANPESTSRRGLSKSDNAATPITPPARYISSNFSTPGSTYGKEDDAVILELSSRYIKAGIEGESSPQCKYEFKPGNNKRVGDYRQYLPSYVVSQPSLEREQWGAEYELWRNDLRDVDLGLLSDRLERAVREIYNKNLLVDAGNSRLVLVVPSLLAHPILETVLQTLFERWAFPSITLLPTPATALVGAGLRSGLVVDIGWEETVVTVMYEYREVRSHRSTRAMKEVTRTFAKYAQSTLPADCKIDLETIEGFVRRVARHGIQCVAKGMIGANANEKGSSTQPGGAIALDWPTASFAKPVSLPTEEVGKRICDTLLGTTDEDYTDDEETPLHRLIYKALLLLPSDIRGMCISRIVFTGDGSANTGLPSLILSFFSRLLNTRGWTGVDGSKTTKQRRPLTELSQARTSPADARHDDVILSDKQIPEERYLRDKQKSAQLTVHSVVRQVETLDSFAGASLLTALKVKSFVEVQRDRFVSHGLTGASRDLEQSVLPQQRSGTLGMRPKAGERTSWTMAGWG